MAVGKRIEEKVTAPPVPGSELDTLLMTELQHIYEKATPIVMKLRNDPDYEEQGVYGNYTEDESPHRLTSGPLRGGRGLAMQVGLSSPLLNQFIWLANPMIYNDLLHSNSTIPSDQMTTNRVSSGTPKKKRPSA